MSMIVHLFKKSFYRKFVHLFTITPLQNQEKNLTKFIPIQQNFSLRLLHPIDTASLFLTLFPNQ